MPAVLARAINRRTPTRQHVQQVLDDVEVNSSTLDHGTLVGYQTMLEDDLQVLTAFDDEIYDEYVNLNKDDQFLTQEWKECIEFRNKIKRAQGIIKVCLIAFQTQVSTPGTALNSDRGSESKYEIW